MIGGVEAAAFTTFPPFRIGIQAGNADPFYPGCTLFPGFEFVVENTTINNATTVGIFWRERAFLESESA